ncbi:MAG TPA: RNA methyltransferase [Nitrospiria bacterium]
MVEPLKKIDIVLVRPSRPGNIGSAARAIKNMGLSRLVLVQPVKHLSSEAYTMAYGAHDILEKAKVYPSLARALSRIHTVFGTTRRIHKGYGKPEILEKSVPKILRKAEGSRVAVLFGSESSGLSNEDLGMTQGLISIPTGPAHTSLNLSQAVMVVAYELRRMWEKKSGPKKTAKQRVPLDSDQRERYYAELDEILTLIGFRKGTQGNHILADLRRIYGRADLDPRELQILRGINRKVKWTIRYGAKKKTD